MTKLDILLNDGLETGVGDDLVTARSIGSDRDLGLVRIRQAGQRDQLEYVGSVEAALRAIQSDLRRWRRLRAELEPVPGN